jgi:hypothetical protein
VFVAAVTVPAAPLLNVTKLLLAVELNPEPLIVMLLAFAAKLSVLLVTTGAIVATCTAAPLLTLFVETLAVKLPAVVGGVVMETLNEVFVAVSTVPAAPLLKVMVLLPATVSNPKPAIVMVLASASKLAELLVITGFTVAT